jgi:CHAT domain-containing protein
LQELLKVCSDLGDSQTVEARLEKGTQYLEELLRQCQFEGEKITLGRKFAAFNQLWVDALAQSPDKKKQIAALELAEKRKNTCLGWLRHGWDYVVPSPKYQQMQQLLNPKTAAIYWHVSPTAITTFILRHKKDPLVWTLKPNTQNTLQFGFFSQRVTASKEAHLEAIRKLEAFEDWIATWKRDYENYRADKTKNDLTKDHPWRQEMAARLQQLAKILDIPRILTQLDGVKQLILIPHRDLHLLPLHYLFELDSQQDFTITYLPSIQLGLELQLPNPNTRQQLLSVEHPETKKRLRPDKPLDLLFAEIESAVISQAYRNPTRISGRNASRVRVIEALKTTANLFHFTGHGYHDVEEPLKSALALTGEDVLTLHDIFELKSLDYYLVSLSACESGITSKQGLIDEFVGLVSGFLAVGATHVVSTLWTVDELSTALIMIHFYQLLEDMAPANALKQAQYELRTLTYPQLSQWYLNLSTPFADSDLGCWQNLQSLSRKAQKQADRMGTSYCPYEHPYYWAGFTITGKVL